MADRDTLLEQARRLRAAARTIREQADALDDPVRGVQDHYALPSSTLWDGPNALLYRDHLERVRSDLVPVRNEAHRYADDCEDVARAKERQAADLEVAPTG